jgi:hypothetical protein
MKSNVASAVLAASLIVLASSAAAFTPAGSRGTVAALGDADRARLAILKSIGGWVYYPASVPERFKLNSVEVRAGGRNPSHLDYRLTYCDRAGVCFEIESVADGIGDAGLGKDIRALSAVSPYFGKFTVWARGRGADKNYLSDWLEDPAMAVTRRNGGTLQRGVVARFHHFTGAGVTDPEAIAIAESLTPLR